MTEPPQDTFVGMIGHELRSPLTSVLGYAQLLRAGALTDEQHRYVDVIERNGRRLLRLIDELSVSAQLSDAGFTVTREDVDLAEVARAGGEDLAPTARAAGLSFTVLAPGTVPMSGDPVLLAQMVTSLLGHAVALTPRGGTVTMRVDLREGLVESLGESLQDGSRDDRGNSAPGGPVREQEAVIEVVDTGAGIGPDELGRLTERLYRARSTDSRDIRGIGLGLPVVQAIVDAHGGTMAIDSPLGTGTRVTVTLPARSLTGPATSRATPASRAATGGSSPEAGSTPR